MVDIPPNRPEYRRVLFHEPVSLEPDPTLSEIESAGGGLEGNYGSHTVAKDTFFISGEIPRQTTYEGRILGDIQYEPKQGKWETDELIMEERFVMRKVKGNPSVCQFLALL